jgi:hypothetical protein
MEVMVRSYGPGALKVKGTVDGTSFFPGGAGLWRGTKAHGVMPALFPNNPVMILGHNFDSEKGHKGSVERGVERMSQGTWKYLLEYLELASLEPSECFFTNVFVGLQPVAAEGKMYASDAYYQECRQFLMRQIEAVRPRIIAILGADASEQFQLIRAAVSEVELRHPGNFRFIKSVDRPSIVAEQGKRLMRALNSSTYANGSNHSGQGETAKV